MFADEKGNVAAAPATTVAVTDKAASGETGKHKGKGNGDSANAKSSGDKDDKKAGRKHRVDKASAKATP